MRTEHPKARAFTPASARRSRGVVLRLFLTLALATAAGCSCDGRQKAPGPCVGCGADAGPGDGGSPCPPCTGATRVCDVTAGECVECVRNTDCFDVAFARCDPGTRTCTPCAGDGECDRFMDNRFCDLRTGICSGCTLPREIALCGEDSCDALLRVCTDTPRGTVARCEPCRSSSECGQGDDRCVPMAFAGEPRPGGFCLRPFDAGCPRPFRVETPGRAPLGTDDDASWCGLDEVRATCEAVRDLGRRCDTAAECGAAGLEDALCVDVGDDRRCTYACATDGGCPPGSACLPAGHCAP